MDENGAHDVKNLTEKKTNLGLFAILCRQLLFGLRFLIWEKGGKQRG